MAYTIRPAGPPDLATIQQLAAAVWPVAYRDILSSKQLAYMLGLFYSEEALADQMARKEHRFFLAADDAKTPVGFASFSVKDGMAHLHKLYVLPQTQGSGVGAALVAHCEAAALKANAATMQLNVNRRNRAKTFYERYGYHVIHEEDIAIGGDFFMNDYRMEKPLQNQSAAV